MPILVNNPSQENLELDQAMPDHYVDKLVQGFPALKIADSIGLNYLWHNFFTGGEATSADVTIPSPSSQNKRKNSQDIEKLLSLVPNDRDKVKVAQGFEALDNADIHYQGNAELYQALINHAQYADKLAQDFVALINADIHYQKNPELYLAVINNAHKADKVAQGFAALKMANVHYQGNVKLCMTVIANADYINILAQGFVALENAGIPYQKNPELCMTVIKNAYYADKLAQGFVALENAGIPYQGNAELCMAVINNAHNANKLAQGFAALENADVPYQGNAELCLAVINNAHNANKLAQGFAALENAGIPYQRNATLCLAVIKNACHADKLAQNFAALKMADVPYQGNATLCLAVINNAYHADKLEKGFAVLINAGIHYQKNPELYQAVINDAYHANELAQGFAALENAGIPYQKNPELYQAVINNPMYANILVQGFAALAQSGIFYADNMKIYQATVDNASDADKLPLALKALNTLVTYQEHPEYFNAGLLITNDDLMQHVINKLNESGYSFQAHEKLFNALLNLLSNEQVSYLVVLKIVDQACTYAKNNTLIKDSMQSGFSRQLQELEAIVDASPWDSLTLGPLNKSGATVKIEELLELISKTDIDNDTLMSFKAPESYILKLPGRDAVNLSLLIKNANLSQLNLSNELVIKLDNILKKLMREEWKNTSMNPIVTLLPEAHKAAITKYNSKYYKNINKLFRSEALDELRLHEQDDKNLLAYFLIGCLLNDAANLINILPWELDEKEHSALRPKITLLDRKEKLDKETITRRTANAWTFPALTSFSRFKEGSSYFDNEQNIRTKLEGTYNHYSINDNEGEVIFPQGEQVLTTPGQNSRCLNSRIVRTSSLDPKNHYWSDVALEHVFNNYLSKEYTEYTSVISLKGRNIVRPNHGLAHSYRVMICIEQVINYFAHYAQDEEFKEFCQSLTDINIEWLRVAAAFSVTGRESEIHSTDNLDLYQQYRDASTQYFEAFVKTEEEDPMMSERMAHVIRYMGNPGYESEKNNHPDEDECKLRNFFHRILSVAHNMDGARCYSPTQYHQSMWFSRDLSIKSDEQQNALNEIIRYNIQLIKAHGNMLHCDIQANGEFVDAHLDYKDIFAECSHSLKRLSEVTQTVPKPPIKQPFQFLKA